MRVLIEKKDEKLTKNEQRWRQQALESAKLLASYGKSAAVALAGRRLRVSDAEEIFLHEKGLTDHFFELIIEAERNALKRRF